MLHTASVITFLLIVYQSLLIFIRITSSSDQLSDSVYQPHPKLSFHIHLFLFVSAKTPSSCEWCLNEQMFKPRSQNNQSFVCYMERNICYPNVTTLRSGFCYRKSVYLSSVCNVGASNQGFEPFVETSHP